MAHDLDTAIGLAAAIRAGELSPQEALDACLERIDRSNGDVNAVIWRDDEDARRRADDAARRLGDGDDAPFLGVPIPIKDLTPVAGQPCTYGSHGAPDTPAPQSELSVLALERAGFVLCGRTNTPEFGPITATDNDRYGSSRNPWDLERTPGGSSGGAGAAVAAGMFPVAHATDGGGSIRIPASCCGLVGLKPSRARVPLLAQAWEGAVVELAVTNTVADAAALLDVMSGEDRTGWWTVPAPARPYAEEVGAEPGTLRVGLCTQAPLGLPIDDACVQAAEEAGRTLEALGHAVEPVDLDPLPMELIGPFAAIIAGNWGNYQGIDWDRVESHNAASRANALQMTSVDYRAAVKFIEEFSRTIVARWGRDFDVLLTPTLATEPPAVGAVLEEAKAAGGAPAATVLRMVAFTALGNVTGLPAISLPLGTGSGGIPVGVQIVGPPRDEALLVRLAAQVEQAAPWAGRRAPLRAAT